MRTPFSFPIRGEVACRQGRNSACLSPFRQYPRCSNFCSGVTASPAPPSLLDRRLTASYVGVVDTDFRLQASNRPSTIRQGRFEPSEGEVARQGVPLRVPGAPPERPAMNSIMKLLRSSTAPALRKSPFRCLA